MHYLGLLYSLLMVVCFGFPPIQDMQGFGVDMPLVIYRQEVGGDEISIRTRLGNNTYMKLLDEQILLSSQIVLKDLNNVVIEGSSTFKNHGLSIINCQNVVLYNIRIFNTTLDGILISNSSNIVLHHITVLDSSRIDIDRGKDIDVTQNSSNITISYSIVGYIDPPPLEKYKGMLIANFSHDRVTNMSLHHCLFYQNYQRSPQISTPGLFDLKNNIVFDFQEYGTRVRNNAYGNFQANYYIGGKKDPIVFIDSGPVWAKNNFWAPNYDEWIQIPEILQNYYEVPAVTVLPMAQLKQSLKKWGCPGKFSYNYEMQIIQKVLSHFNSELSQSQK